jgi:hypothetical protein
MLSGKIIAFQKDNCTKPVMQNFLYFKAVVNTQVGTTEIMLHKHLQAHHGLYTFYRHITTNTTLATYHSKHNVYRYIRAHTEFTDISRQTQHLQTH